MIFAVTGWSLYNLPILVAGVKALHASKCKIGYKSINKEDLPSISIIVPVKDEEKVVERLLNALAEIAYPSDKLEVIIVEDCSTDDSFNICRRFAQNSNLNLKIFHRELCNGKPSALNFGVKHAKGDIIGILDADSIPAPDILLNLTKYFEDPEVAAVQGRTSSINFGQNMLTKFISYEEAAVVRSVPQGQGRLEVVCQFEGKLSVHKA